MERQHLRLIRAVIVLVAVFGLLCACGATDTARPAKDTDTVDPEDVTPEGDIVGSGYW